MPHIHTQPGQYDFTASGYIVVIRPDLPEPAILFHKHKILHKWLQFGGHVELHENPWQAVTHELLEESGYAMQQLTLLQPPHTTLKLAAGTLHPWPVATVTVQFGDIDHFHTDIAYAFTTAEEPHQPAEEVAETCLMTRDQIADLPDSEILGDVRSISLYILDECLANWQAVPAADW